MGTIKLITDTKTTRATTTRSIITTNNELTNNNNFITIATAVSAPMTSHLSQSDKI